MEHQKVVSYRIMLEDEFVEEVKNEVLTSPVSFSHPEAAILFCGT